MKDEKTKNQMIDALYIAALRLSKNPELILDSIIISDYGNGSINDNTCFVIEIDKTGKQVCQTDHSAPLIYINYELFKKLSEITRLYVVMWSGFVYSEDWFKSFLFLNNELKVDSETIKYLITQNVITLENSDSLIQDILHIISNNDGTTSSKGLRRLANVVNCIPNQFLTKN